ncbi:MAG: hypothetical protein Q7S16_00625, partial [bacterium]|nr:hypothetical protein [bacterium]
GFNAHHLAFFVLGALASVEIVGDVRHRKKLEANVIYCPAVAGLNRRLTDKTVSWTFVGAWAIAVSYRHKSEKIAPLLSFSDPVGLNTNVESITWQAR